MSPTPQREYSRLYHDLVDDPMFADVYPNDAAFATWCRLLMLGEQAHPSSAHLPLGVSKRGLKMLVDAGLVTVTGVRFTVRGLDKERALRSAKGHAGASARWNPEQSERTANASDGQSERNAIALPTQSERNARQDKPRRDETRRAAPSNARGRFITPEDGLPHITPEIQEAAESRVGTSFFQATDKVQTDLDGLVERQGPEKVLRTFPRVDDGRRVSWPQLVYGARNILEPIPRADQRKIKGEDEADEERSAFQKRLQATDRRIRELYGDKLPGASDAA